jgi:hypothetical protein
MVMTAMQALLVCKRASNAYRTQDGDPTTRENFVSTTPGHLPSLRIGQNERPPYFAPDRFGPTPPLAQSSTIDPPSRLLARSCAAPHLVLCHPLPISTPSRPVAAIPHPSHAVVCCPLAAARLDNNSLVHPTAHLHRSSATPHLSVPLPVSTGHPPHSSSNRCTV